MTPQQVQEAVNNTIDHEQHVDYIDSFQRWFAGHPMEDTMRQQITPEEKAHAINRGAEAIAHLAIICNAHDIKFSDCMVAAIDMSEKGGQVDEAADTGTSGSSDVQDQ